MVVWGGLIISWEKKKGKEEAEKENYTHLKAEFQRKANRDKKASLSDQCKEIEESSQHRWQFFPPWYISNKLIEPHIFILTFVFL